MEIRKVTWKDAKTAVNVAQTAATLYIQGKEPYLLDGVSLLALARVATSGKTFDTIPDLQETLAA
jgi:hypothetical protein